MNDLLKLIEEELLAIADPEKAQEMKSYMKDHFEYYGVQSPERKVIVRFIWQENKESIRENWRELFQILWKANGRESQYVAMDLMQKIKSLINEDDLSLIEFFILDKSWWDTVDFIASHMAGKYFEKFPQHIKTVIPQWMESENIWLNRTAILYQLKYKEKTDFEILKTNILYHIDSKEFFINKASGWALRQHSKFKPEEVSDFIKANPKLSNLTKKEASKYL